VKLSSAGFLEGLHRGKPGVDMELLARHSEGLRAHLDPGNPIHVTVQKLNR
jgi:hypothetical protein